MSDSETPANGVTSRAPEAAGFAPERVAPRASGLNRGHAVAAVAFISTGLSVGMTSYGFGVFVEPLAREFGWSRAQINAGFSIGFVAAVSAPLYGALIDRFGARPVMFVSLLLMASGFLIRTGMTQLWHWYAVSGLVSLGSAGAALLPAGKLVGTWFPRTRGRMMGTVASGSNLGGAIIVPAATWIVAASGWRMAYAAFGLALIGVAVAVAIVVRDRPGRESAEPTRKTAENDKSGGLTLRDAVRTPLFYFLAVGLTASAFTHPLILTQLMPHLINEGLTATTAAWVLTVSSVVALSSKIIMGWLSERITARNATVVCLVIVSAGIGMFIAAGSTWLVWPAVLVFGLGLGGFGALRTLVVAESFGMRAFGGIMGVFTFLTVVPIVSGPLLAGFTFDATQHYGPAFGAAIGIFLFGAVVLTLAGSVAKASGPSTAAAR
ncbi:MAG: MFS transporter [Chloroflexi bacterium]|nr:MFS transporter [Chloroflexota bacterium]